MESKQPSPRSTPSPLAPPPSAAAAAFQVQFLPFVVLGLAMAAEQFVPAADVHLGPTVVIGTVLALVVSFHVSIRSLHCFFASRPQGAAPAAVEPRSEAAVAIVAAVGVVVVWWLLVAGGVPSVGEARS